MRSRTSTSAARRLPSSAAETPPYGDYFCDAIEEVYSAMKEAGAEMVGSVATDGYDFSESKSVIDGKFCGLPLDEDAV